MPDHDKSTQMIAIVFIIAFFFHVIQENIPTSIDVWPAKPSLNGQTMKAIVYSKAGSDLRFVEDHPIPVIRPHQVLIKVKYSALNPCDFKFRRNWTPNFLLPKPKIPGEDLSGVIVQVGSKVGVDRSNNEHRSNLEVGDRVAAMMPILGARWGALAEYAAVDASLVAKVGDHNTTLEQAAALPLVALTAVQALSNLDPKHRKSILIQAGAGGVGSFAIQYARNVLKMERIATTASAGKADLLKELGADEVIDYRVDNFEDVVQGYDAVLDTMSWAYEERTLTKGVLKKRGHYLNVLSSDWMMHGGSERANGIQSIVNYMYSKVRNMILPGHVPRYDLVMVNPNGEQLQAVLDLMEDGTLRSVIDRTFPLSKANEAFSYLEQGHAMGKVLIDHDL
ncbi:oxidoreductase [Fragilaria crotonensis]|nr:oxidoreductase [Fragilaria crotonensis]